MYSGVGEVMSTSRVGRKPITIPSGVDVKIHDQNLTIKGPKGQSIVAVNPLVLIEIEGGILKIKQNDTGEYSRSGIETKLKRSIAGTMRSKINSVISGVTKGFERKLILFGVGYKAQMKGNTLHLSLGYSHPVSFTAVAGVTIEAPTPTEVIIKGIDKHQVGQAAAMIRDLRPPELYKGKGIRYSDEIIILKETKKK